MGSKRGCKFDQGQAVETHLQEHGQHGRGQVDQKGIKLLRGEILPLLDQGSQVDQQADHQRYEQQRVEGASLVFLIGAVIIDPSGELGRHEQQEIEDP